MERDARRLYDLFERDWIISCIESVNRGVRQEKQSVKYSLKAFVNKYCFNDWKSRGRCISLFDFLDTLQYELMAKQATYRIEDFFSLIELIYNMWALAAIYFDKYKSAEPIGNFIHLKNLMNDILQQYNHTIYYDKQNECVYVIEDKPEVTAACEIVSPSLSLEIIKYNHRTLKGNIELKKQILVDLGAKIEPERKYLKTIDDKLEDDIFFALNNLNLRHNNIKQGDKNYHELVEKMSNEELEEWYDEVYQMILLALLLIDHKSRTEKIKQLKKDIAGENKNGQT